MSDFDIVVVGAGPGGLSAGEAAARAGCSVLILEQGQEIGSPTRTTGGSFIQDLKALGIPEHLYHPIKRCRFVSPGNSAAFDYDDPILCVIDVRGVFQFLAERAIDAGAKIRMAATAVEPVIENDFTVGVKVKAKTGANFTVGSKILVDATGYRAAILKQAGIHPGFQRFGVGSEYDLYAPRCDQDEAVLIVGTQVAPSGYAWIFPWGRNRVRVGVGIIHGDSKEHPDRYLDEIVERSAQFGVNLNGAQPVEYHYGLIPSDGLMKVFTGNGILGVGDSAGQSSALAGEGIRWAIKAGRMAGAVAGKAIAAKDVSRVFLRQYQREWEAAFGTNLRIAYEINKRIAQFGDEQWDEKTKLLSLFNSYQFGQALQTNLADKWAVQFLWSHPGLLKEGFQEIRRHLKSSRV